MNIVSRYYLASPSSSSSSVQQYVIFSCNFIATLELAPGSWFDHHRCNVNFMTHHLNHATTTAMAVVRFINNYVCFLSGLLLYIETPAGPLVPTLTECMANDNNVLQSPSLFEFISHVATVSNNSTYNCYICQSISIALLSSIMYECVCLLQMCPTVTC